MRSTVCGYVLDAWGLSEVLSKGNSGSAAQVLVDEMEVERSEEAVVEESPKCVVSVGQRGRGYCAEDREPNANLRSCAARRAR